MPSDETNQQRFEVMGIDVVRLHVRDQSFQLPMLTDARIWVAQFDAEERLRNESSQREQILTALSAKKAAIIAAVAAIAAIAIGIVGVIVSILAWLYPHAPN